MSIPTKALSQRTDAALTKLSAAVDALQATCPAAGARGAWKQTSGLLRGLQSQLAEMTPLLGKRRFDERAFVQLLRRMLDRFDAAAATVLPPPENAITEWPSLLLYQRDPDARPHVLGQDPSEWIKLLQSWTDELAACAVMMPEKDDQPAKRMKPLVNDLYSSLTGGTRDCICGEHHGNLLRMASYRARNKFRHEITFELLHQPHRIGLEAKSHREFCVIMRRQKLAFASGRMAASSSSKTYHSQVEVPKICASFKDFRALQTLQLSYQNGRLWQRRGPGPPLKYTSSSQHSSTRNLAEVLERISGSDMVVLGLKCRWCIAATVVHAFYHLHGSSWMPQNWSRDSIRFLETEDKLFLIPFIDEESHVSSEDDSDGQISDMPLFELGVFLLELYKHQPLSEMEGYDAVLDSTMSRSDFVNDILAEIVDQDENTDEDDCFIDALVNCLYEMQSPADMSTTTIVVDELDFHQHFFTEVVQPLEAGCDRFYSVTADMLDRLMFVADFGESTQQSMLLDPDETEDTALVSGHDASKGRPTLFDAGDVHCDQGEVQMAKEWFQRLQREAAPFFDQLTTLASPVVVAVLDTGANMGDSLLKMKRHQILWKDFTDEPRQGPADTHGHGTQVARLVLKTAPRAHVGVVRVCQDGSLPSAHLIADAIRHAVDEWHADVINMSFGYPARTEDNAIVYSAVLHAHSRGTVMFAAASNDGANRPIAFPASANEVVCIHSTDGKGNALGSNPSVAAGKQWSILGTGTSSGAGASIRYYSGTSFAAPVAAGVAGLVVEFMRAAPESSTKKLALDMLRHAQGMEKILTTISDARGDHRHIVPWKLFQLVGSQSIDEARAESWAMISTALTRA